MTNYCSAALGVFTAALFFLCGGAQQVSASGFRTLVVNDLKIGVWYPSDTPEQDGRLGPFDVKLAFDAPIKKNGRFQFILMSHGNKGRMRNHYSSARALANAGFIAVAPLHAADHLLDGDDMPKVLHWRVTELRDALEAVLQIDSFRAAADLSRVHALGYSLGAATALNAAGAGFDLAAFDEHCRREDDPAYCDEPELSFFAKKKIVFLRGAVTPDLERDIPRRYFPAPFVNGGVAVLAPVGRGIIYDKNMFRARKLFIAGMRDDKVTLPEFHARHLSEIFPERYVAHFSIRPGQHHAFIPPFAKRVTNIEDIPAAKDPLGFDRRAFLDGLNRELAAFFLEQAESP